MLVKRQATSYSKTFRTLHLKGHSIMPSPSGGGGSYSFSSNRDGNEEICVMDSDGSDVTRLAHNPAPSTPVWVLGNVPLSPALVAAPHPQLQLLRRRTEAFSSSGRPLPRRLDRRRRGGGGGFTATTPTWVVKAPVTWPLGNSKPPHGSWTSPIRQIPDRWGESLYAASNNSVMSWQKATTNIPTGTQPNHSWTWTVPVS